MKELTEKAQADRDNFDAEDSCCSCHLHPPCGHCTHPGNPLNQDGDPDCWDGVERNYGGHSWKNVVIKAFEEYERSLDYSFGDHPDDFMPWFLCFEAGFEAGGCS